MSKARYSIAIVLSLPLSCTVARAADGVAPAPAATQSVQSNLIHASTLPWQTQCEWNDASGKSRILTTDGRDRPDKKVVPESAMCRQTKKFTFPSGVGISETRYQMARPTSVQSDTSANLVYVASGRARHQIGSESVESEPGDAFIQSPGKGHRTAAISTDYVEIAMHFPNGSSGTLPDEFVHRRDISPADICFVDAKKTVVRNAANAAIIPPDAPCFTIYGYARLKRSGYSFLEVVAKKGSKTIPHPEDEDTITYYVKGRVRATVGGETGEMGAGDAIFEPRGVPHADEFLEDTIQIEFKLPGTAKAP